MSISDKEVSLDELSKIKWMFEEQQRIGHFGTWEWDIQNNVSIWSQEVCKIYGIDPKSKINYEIASSFRHPDDWEIAKNALRSAINDKKPFNINYRIIRTDGEIRYVYGYGKVYYDESGAPKRLFGTLQDVTDYKVAQMDKEFKAGLLSAVNEAIIATDENYCISYWNAIAESAFGLKEQQAVGLHYQELINLIKPEINWDTVKAQMSQSKNFKFEVRFQNSHGDIRFHEVRTRLIRDQHGKLIGSVSAARDITERKTSEATINRQNIILKAINSVYKHAMNCDKSSGLGKACLEIIETITESPFSFAGEIDSSGYYHRLAYRKPAIHSSEDIDGVRAHFFDTHRNLFTSGNTMLINDMAAHPMPKGHPKIENILCVPYKRNAQIVGLLGVFNREGGYTQEHKEILEAVTPAILETLLNKRAEQRVRESEMLMRTVMDSASDFLFLKDRDSRVVMVNHAYGRIFNTDINNVIGKNDYELYEDQELAGQVIANDRRVMRTGETLICQESTMTAEGFKTFSLSKVPWRDADGQIIGLLGIGHDITELKQTKDSLQETVASLRHSKEYIEILYETTGKILSSDTPRTDIEELCKKVMQFLGCDCFFNYFYEEGEDALHLNCCYGIPSDSVKALEILPCGAAVCGYAVQQRCRVVAENIQYHFDKKTVELKPLGIRAYACHPLMANGTVLGSLAFGTRTRDKFKQEDLKLMKAVAESVAVSLRRKKTEEKLLNQANELEYKNRLITDFFINLSHEFKTPISILKLAAELMDHYVQSGQVDKQDISRHLNMIKTNANRLTRLVSNLLDMTKVDAGFMSPKITCFDIVDFLKNMVQSISLFATKRGLKIYFETSTSSRLFFTDVEFIERIILNLVSNAIKHTPKGGKIIIRLEDGENSMTLAVIDNGEGIPEDKKDIIFDRFRQVDNSLSRSNDGCGIGLALTKSLVELLGGRIWFKSKLGEGSEFIAELPNSNIKTESSMVVQPDNLQNRIIMELSDISFD